MNQTIFLIALAMYFGHQAIQNLAYLNFDPFWKFIPKSDKHFKEYQDYIHNSLTEMPSKHDVLTQEEMRNMWFKIDYIGTFKLYILSAISLLACTYIALYLVNLAFSPLT
jgi:hypothetical protein